MDEQTRRREARRLRREAIRAGRSQPSVHGVTGYNEGCRCDVCVAARRDYDSVRQANKRSNNEE